MLTGFKIIFVVILALTVRLTNGSAIRIIGGTPATRGEFPWMVSIQYTSLMGTRHICGGAIINTTSVVTGVACVNFEMKNLLIVAGAYNITMNESSQQKTHPTSVYIHPEYQMGELIRHDLAVIQVETPFQFNQFVGAINLPGEHHKATGNCLIAGWGMTNYASSSDILLKANLPIVNVDDCYKTYQDLLDRDNQMCAGYPQGGIDACTGDTGGPLMCKDVGYTYLAGIASWGYKCAAPNYPGVYTELSSYTKNLNPTVRKIMY